MPQPSGQRARRSAKGRHLPVDVAAKGVDIEVQGADGKSQRLSYERLLVATGRGPVTEGLGADKLGIKMDRGYIVVDQMFKTSVPGIRH